MNMIQPEVDPPRVDCAAPMVIAIHCSGNSARQWLPLVTHLEPRFKVVPIDLIGAGNNPDWPGRGPITLSTQARTVQAVATQNVASVHLVGHSYGGAVALTAALALGSRLASLTLLEPSLFHILGLIGGEAGSDYREIRSVADHVGREVLSGDSHGAMAAFVDYWNGAGTWDRVKPPAQDRLASQALKAAMDFSALFSESTPPSRYAQISAPVLILHGADSPAPSIRICEILADVVPQSAIRAIWGAGHMLPITHAEVVNAAIEEFLLECDSGEQAGPVDLAA